MHFPKTLAALAIAFVGVTTHLAEAFPIASSSAAEAYVPVSMRSYTAAEIEAHEALQKRSTSGFNDWSCKPTAKHPNPIVLVHGTSASGWNNWLYMAPRWASKGYCVYALTYGKLPGIPILSGLDIMENSAVELSDFVDKVLASTNATKVDMVGHSQGTLMPRYYLKNLGGAAKVDKFAGIGSLVQGTDLLSLLPLLNSLGLSDPLKKIIDPICKSCFQMLVGSPFLKELNAGGDTVPGVKYLFLASKYDQAVTPYTNGFFHDNNPNAKNVVIQDLCAVDFVDHIMQMADPIVFNRINAFFDPQADQTINCLDAYRR